jgi:hypothetical protein
VDHGDAGFGQALVVAGETAGSGEPSEGALDDPAARDDVEALGSFLQPVPN